MAGCGEDLWAQAGGENAELSAGSRAWKPGAESSKSVPKIDAQRDAN
jgi:hypothetical protein